MTPNSSSSALKVGWASAAVGLLLAILSPLFAAPFFLAALVFGIVAAVQGAGRGALLLIAVAAVLPVLIARAFQLVLGVGA